MVAILSIVAFCSIVCGANSCAAAVRPAVVRPQQQFRQAQPTRCASQGSNKILFQNPSASAPPAADAASVLVLTMIHDARAWGTGKQHTSRCQLAVGD